MTAFSPALHRPPNHPPRPHRPSTRGRRAGLGVAIALAVGLAPLAAAAPAAAAPITVVFNGDGSWTVPAGVTSVSMTVVGADGGAGGDFTAAGRRTAGAQGGAGDVVATTFAVTPGDVLSVTVGKPGAKGTQSPGAGGAGATAGGRGGYGGIDPLSFDPAGGGGGGSTSVRTSASAGLIVEAAGGGGGGASENYLEWFKGVNVPGGSGGAGSRDAAAATGALGTTSGKLKWPADAPTWKTGPGGDGQQTKKYSGVTGLSYGGSGGGGGGHQSGSGGLSPTAASLLPVTGGRGGNGGQTFVHAEAGAASAAGRPTTSPAGQGYVIISAEQATPVVQASAPASAFVGVPFDLTIAVTDTNGRTLSGPVSITSAAGTSAGTVVDGELVFPVSASATGPLTFTVVFLPGTALATSETATTTVALQPVTLTAAPLPSSVHGEPVSVAVVATSDVDGGTTPTGAVEAYGADDVLVGSGSLVDGQVTLDLTASLLPAGTSTLSLRYGGDASHATAEGSADLTRTVPTTLVASGTSGRYGAAQSLSGAVQHDAGSASVPSGTITASGLSDEPIVVPLVEGAFVVTTPAGLPAGAYVVDLGYSGDDLHAPSQSTVEMVVTKNGVVVLISGPSAVKAGATSGWTVTVTGDLPIPPVDVPVPTAEVQPSAADQRTGGDALSPDAAEPLDAATPLDVTVPTGVVELSVDGGDGVTADLSEGVARFTVDALPAGSHTISATYLGSDVHGSDSAPTVEFAVTADEVTPGPGTDPTPDPGTDPTPGPGTDPTDKPTRPVTPGPGSPTLPVSPATPPVPAAPETPAVTTAGAAGAKAAAPTKAEAHLATTGASGVLPFVLTAALLVGAGFVVRRRTRLG